jgi:YD repeat-containing protein
VLLALARLSFAQAPITFQYYYDDLGQLTRAVDSTGVSIGYVYDAVGNILQVTRSTVSTGALTVFNITPQQSTVGAIVTIQGQGFSATPSANVVTFNGVSATVISATATSLVVQVPLTATTGPVVVKVGTAATTYDSNFKILLIPVITSMSSKSALSNTTIPKLTVTGFNLAGATFSFSTPAITITSASTDSMGTSAILSLNVGLLAGTFALVATNTFGSSTVAITPANRFTVVDPNSNALGANGYPAVVDATFGADPLDPASVPNLAAFGNLLGPVFSVLNNVMPFTGQPVQQNVASLTFSVLNNVTPFTGQPVQQNILGATFSVLNNMTPFTGQPVQQNVLGPLFSVLNNVMPFTTQTVREDLLGPAFSILNSPGTPLTNLERTSSNATNVKKVGGNPGNGDSVPKAPVVSITSPADGAVLVEGQTIKVSALVTDEPELRRVQVQISVNSVPFITNLTPPYTLTFTVPAGVTSLTFRASALNAAGDVVSSPEVAVSVIPDRLTTIKGRIVDSGGSVVSGARVEILSSGLKSEFFDFNTPLTTLPSVVGRIPDRTGFVSAINLRNPNQVFGTDPFGVQMSPDYAARFTGWIHIENAGTYKFLLGADEGARLALNGATVLEIPNGNGQLQEASGAVTLTSGLIPIEVTYYNSVGNAELQLSYQPPGYEMQVIPPSAFVANARSLATNTNDRGEFSIPGIPSVVGDVQIKATVEANGQAASKIFDVISRVQGEINIGDIVVARPR